MNLMGNQRSGLAGAWVGSLEDSLVHSVIAGDLVQIGASVVGAWMERRDGDSGYKEFRSRLSGCFNNGVLSLSEERSDKSNFRVRLTLSQDGKRLVGQWRTQPGKKWFPIRLHKYEGDGVFGKKDEERKYPAPQS